MSGVIAWTGPISLNRGHRLAIFGMVGLIAFLTLPVLAQDGTGPVPENAEARSYGGGWDCTLGYRVDSEECVAIDIPENAYATGRSYGSGWACERGYQEVGGTSCEAIPVPENAFLQSSGFDWQCDRGYRQDRETCVPIDLPENAYLTNDPSGSGWDCARGFTALTDACVPIAVPENGYLTNADYGAEWACERGFFEIDGRCDPVALPANAFLDQDSYGPGWRCERGFEAVNDTCVAIHLPATPISTDPETAGAATAAFSSRTGSAFLDDSTPRSRPAETSGVRMRIGCRLRYQLTQPTPIIAMLNVHYSRFGDLERADYLVTQPSVPLESYRDAFGNWCTRMVAPAGNLTLSTDGIFRDTGLPDPKAPEAEQHAVQELPFETLAFLLGSRYCDADLLSDEAWRLFESTPPGWARVQAICAFVHSAVSFDYMQASATRTASETLAGGQGVCRDFTHLAIALCRCMNIPARYCTGYLSEFGQPTPHPPDDFAAWMEVFLGGRWWVFDPRNNCPRLGRILIARGRDAADVPLTQTFGPNTLTQFDVWTWDAEDHPAEASSGSRN